MNTNLESFNQIQIIIAPLMQYFSYIITTSKQDLTNLDFIRDCFQNKVVPFPKMATIGNQIKKYSHSYTGVNLNYEESQTQKKLSSNLMVRKEPIFITNQVKRKKLLRSVEKNERSPRKDKSFEKKKEDESYDSSDKLRILSHQKKLYQCECCRGQNKKHICSHAFCQKPCIKQKNNVEMQQKQESDGQQKMKKVHKAEKLQQQKQQQKMAEEKIKQQILARQKTPIFQISQVDRNLNENHKQNYTNLIASKQKKPRKRRPKEQKAESEQKKRRTQNEKRPRKKALSKDSEEEPEFQDDGDESEQIQSEALQGSSSDKLQDKSKKKRKLNEKSPSNDQKILRQAIFQSSQGKNMEIQKQYKANEQNKEGLGKSEYGYIKEQINQQKEQGKVQHQILDANVQQKQKKVKKDGTPYRPRGKGKDKQEGQLKAKSKPRKKKSSEDFQIQLKKTKGEINDRKDDNELNKQTRIKRKYVFKKNKSEVKEQKESLDEHNKAQNKQYRQQDIQQNKQYEKQDLQHKQLKKKRNYNRKPKEQSAAKNEGNQQKPKKKVQRRKPVKKDQTSKEEKFVCKQPREKDKKEDQENIFAILNKQQQGLQDQKSNSNGNKNSQEKVEIKEAQDQDENLGFGIQQSSQKRPHCQFLGLFNQYDPPKGIFQKRSQYISGSDAENANDKLIFVRSQSELNKNQDKSIMSQIWDMRQKEEEHIKIFQKDQKIIQQKPEYMFQDDDQIWPNQDLLNRQSQEEQKQDEVQKKQQYL